MQSFFFPFRAGICALISLLCLPSISVAQMELTGRLLQVLAEDSPPRAGTEIRAFASPADPRAEPRSFRTWEMPPAGWFRFSGPPGSYTLLFSEPGHFLRPIVRTNLWLSDGERVHDFVVSPTSAYACYGEQDWDPEAASAYLQPFIANGPSVTHVGLKLVTDGVDGVGPDSQDLLVSIHEWNESDPTQGEQIGLTMPIVEVDCGGPKSYHYSAGWNSGEVPVTPGQVYTVRIAPRNPQWGVQAFWSPTDQATLRCYRVGSVSSWLDRRLWMAVACDGDGLVLPYNKRVHQRFGAFAGSAQRWAQSYRAQGHSLAAVICYGAVSGAQPPLSRQRVAVTVRKEDPNGPIVGQPRIGLGEGHYTGDASWGVFGAVFHPAEIPLEPGQRYVIELASVETSETIGGFVNIKGQESDGQPAWNPYRKHALDPYSGGTAFRNGIEPVHFDLDLQIIEYAHPAEDWERATLPANHLLGSTPEPFTLQPDAWTPPAAASNSTLQIAPPPDPAVDGGYVFSVGSLSRLETYRLSGRMRCSWPPDLDHDCLVGLDPTGQSSDPASSTIQWNSWVRRHGHWTEFLSEPMRPAAEQISVWVRARSRAEPTFVFRAEFDGLQLRQVNTAVPGKD